MEKRFILSVFTKFWKEQSIGELAEIVGRLGFTGIEFPLRDGYQAEPATAETSLPAAAKALGGFGIKIMSVAGTTDENIFSACALAGVPFIRIMYGNRPEINYNEAEAEMKRKIEGFLPLCEKYGVRVGIQQHCGPGINNTMEMRRLLEDYDIERVGGVWDAGHSGLAGEEPEQALDIISDRLAFVNFKNAYYRLESGPEASEYKFGHYFTLARHGFCSWKRSVAHLKEIGYRGNICLTAEYSELGNTVKYAGDDCAYMKELIDGTFGEGNY